MHKVNDSRYRRDRSRVWTRPWTTLCLISAVCFLVLAHAAVKTPKMNSADREIIQWARVASARADPPRDPRASGSAMKASAQIQAHTTAPSAVAPSDTPKTRQDRTDKRTDAGNIPSGNAAARDNVPIGVTGTTQKPLSNEPVYSHTASVTPESRTAMAAQIRSGSRIVGTTVAQGGKTRGTPGQPKEWTLKNIIGTLVGSLYSCILDACTVIFGYAFFFGVGWVFFRAKLYQDSEIPVRRIQILFSLTFTLCCSMFLMIIFEILDVLDRNSRWVRVPGASAKLCCFTLRSLPLTSFAHSFAPLIPLHAAPSRF